MVPMVDFGTAPEWEPLCSPTKSPANPDEYMAIYDPNPGQSHIKDSGLEGLEIDVRSQGG